MIWAMEIDEGTVSKRGRKSGEGQHLDEVLALYRAGDSLTAISKKVGVSVQTLSRWMKKAGVEIDPHRGLSAPRGPLSAEHRVAIAESKTGVEIAKRAIWKTEVRQCARCGAEFTPKKKTQTLCSVQCRNALGAASVRKEWLCPCGAALPPRNESHIIYCSTECRAKYGKKRQRDETKWVTKTCLNCGEDFQIRKASQSYGKYCSNECAFKHTKTKHHVTFRESDVLLDSSYEGLVWSALTLAKIPVERYDRSRGVEWSPGRWYAPDLWLPEQQVAIECKGLADDDDPARWQAFRYTGVKLVVLSRDDLMALSPSTIPDVLLMSSATS